MSNASSDRTEREPLISTHELHGYRQLVNAHPHHHHSHRPQHQHDVFFDRQCHSQKSSSDFFEATVEEETSVTARDIQSHPPHREMTDRALDLYKPEWIPHPESPAEKDRPRTLVICFDGTGDQFDDDNSNVVQFLACLKKNDKDRQLVYYQTGIGTTTTSNFITPVMTQISKTLDSMFAWNLASHVQDGYQFLVQNYKAGDRISIFGFSRGAYTARALAGMIQRVGLLPADNTQQIPFAWSMYIRDDNEAEKDSAEYKRTFSTNVIIDFVGVWDTVASVGISGKELPFVRNNTAIRVFRHALALDEHRAKFMPNFYHAGKSSKDAPVATSKRPDSPLDNHILVDLGTDAPTKDKEPSKPTVYPKKDRNTPTDACEVWFAGCHCDVGGGSVKNNTPHSLARIPLRWMIRECFRMKTGIIFDAQLLRDEIGLDCGNLYPYLDSEKERRRPSRIPWSVHSGQIQGIEPQGWGIVTVAKFIISVVAIPIRILLAIILWPLRHTWLFLKFTEPVRSIRNSDRMKNVVLKIQSFGSWLNSKFFTKVKYEPEPCTRGCKSEEEHEYWDALSPIYDQLKIRWFWSVMEYLPLRFVIQTDLRNDYIVRFNRGLGREIYGDALYENIVAPKSGASNGAKTNGKTSRITKKSTQVTSTPVLRHTQGTYHETGVLKIHRSVLTRLEAEAAGQPKYTPLAWWDTTCKDGRKLKSPASWNITNPNPNTHWEWVE